MRIESKMILDVFLLERTFVSVRDFYKYLNIYRYDYKDAAKLVDSWFDKMKKELISDIGIVIDTTEGEAIVEWGKYVYTDIEGNRYIRNKLH